uniref:Thioredoxin domain-containing protein n=1 Tax=Dikerogammarus haemobaphes virus 1 TaxID=2704946 RepID=A0A6G9HEB9_9VIRU|nr:hypothetical protein [Dikerogammarus haemobaphes virus 1]
MELHILFTQPLDMHIQQLLHSFQNSIKIIQVNLTHEAASVRSHYKQMLGDQQISLPVIILFNNGSMIQYNTLNRETFQNMANRILVKKNSQEKINFDIETFFAKKSSVPYNASELLVPHSPIWSKEPRNV